jgi:hypothetical protein
MMNGSKLSMVTTQCRSVNAAAIKNLFLQATCKLRSCHADFPHAPQHEIAVKLINLAS